MNKELIICVGCSGAGKSFWATQFIKDNPNYLRINRDDIRLTLVGDLDGYYQRKDLQFIEHKINLFEQYLFGTLINSEYNIIIDNTNLKQEYINKWIKQLEAVNTNKYSIKFKLFDIELNDAKARVMQRDFNYDSHEIILDDEEFNSIKEVFYIDKQYSDYQQIKQWIINNYKDKII